uniref:Transcription factor SPT20 homolog n=1 Tax=Saccoglossus kowalevskii TaxID=10224 RepID=A0ABM0M967_SACKO|nr:PREDICTED: transcription factor SPT20 homolog [Saccoglossus kowalevskii]
MNAPGKNSNIIMAAQVTSQYNFADTGPEELQKLLKKLEFENEQQLVLIDKENQHIQALENDIQFKYDDIQRLRESTTQLDDETKRVYRQFKQNRTNFESMKKTQLVQQEHEEAMKKKLEFQTVKWQQEKSEYDVLLTQYETTWQTYLEKYESRSMAKELRGIEKLWNKTKEIAEVSQQKVVDLKTEIEKLKKIKEQPKPFESITAWIVSLYPSAYEIEQEKIQKQQIENAHTMTKPAVSEQSEIECIRVEEQGYSQECRNNTSSGNIQDIESQKSQNSEVNQVVRSMVTPTTPTNMPQIHSPETCVSKQPVVRSSASQRPIPKESPKHMITIPQLHMPSIGIRNPQHVPSQQQHVQRPQSTQLLKHIQHQQIQRKLEVAQMNQQHAQQGRTQLEINQQKRSDQTQPRDEMYSGVHQESSSDMIANSQTETQSSDNTTSQYHHEMREFPKTPEHINGSSSANTPSSSSPTCSEGSPFTMEIFKNTLRKSPGFQYASRSMFTSNQIPNSTQETDNNSGGIESPFFHSFSGGTLTGAATSNTESRDDNRCELQFSNLSDSTLFGHSEQQPNHNSSSTGGFSMFGFNNSNADEGSTGFSFNFGGAGNSPENSSGGFSLFQ